MCNKRNSRRVEINGKIIRVDGCMANLIRELNQGGRKTLACCCGHGMYPMTIVAEFKSGRYELMTSVNLTMRKKRFYITDKEGFYYIPEVVSRR